MGKYKSVRQIDLNSFILQNREVHGKMAGILIVDDASFMRTTIKKILEAEGLAVAGEAGSGTEAIQKYRELQPDAVMLDITMPGMSGVEATKRIKEFDENAKIIICSAMGQQTMVAQALQNGAKDFIVKPFAKERVIAAVRRVLG